MKLFKKFEKAGIFFVLMAFMTFMCYGSSYANDIDDLLKRKRSSTMQIGSPMAELEAARHLEERAKSQVDTGEQVERIEAESDTDSEDRTAEEVSPDLKKKGEEATGDITTRTLDPLALSANASLTYNVAIGEGTDQVYEGGRLVSEILGDGVRHIYAGDFEDGTVGFAYDGTTGSIESAMTHANEQSLKETASYLIIVRGYSDGSAYDGAAPILINDTVYTGGDLEIFGGYSEDGTRDIDTTTTTITGGFDIQNLNNATVEINGFDIRANDNGYSSGFWLCNVGGVTIANIDQNTVGGAGVFLMDEWTIGTIVNVTIVDDNGSNLDTTDIRNDALAGNVPDPVFGDASPADWGTAPGDDKTFPGLDIMIGVDVLADTGDTTFIFVGHDLTMRNVGPATETILAITPTRANPLDPELTRKQKMGLGMYGGYGQPGLFGTDYYLGAEGVTEENVKDLFKALLAKREEMLPEKMEEESEEIQAALTKLAEEALEEAALPVAVGEGSPQMVIAMELANIMREPTKEQKVILDAVASLLSEAEKLEEEGAMSEDLKEAIEEFTLMVATVLLLEERPGLLREEAVESIRDIFSEFGEEKTSIFHAYGEEALVKTYYQKLVKELARDLAALQFKDLISKDITRDKLPELTQKRIDEILGRIRRVKDKTRVEKRLLKEDARYEKQYIKPAQRKLTERLRRLIENYNKKLSDILNKAGEKR